GYGARHRFRTRRKRRRLGGRRPRPRGHRACGRGRGERGGARVTERRHVDPSPLGGGDGLPYSKGLMTRTLMATGMPPGQAYELGRGVERDPAGSRRRAVGLDRMGELAVELLGEEEGTAAIERLRRYLALRELELPIVLLVGGSTGSGKSRVATEVAHRL